MNRRNEVLRAVQDASNLASQHPVGSRSSFDLIGLVEELGLPVVFRPLDGLHGAAVTVGDKTGVLVHSGLPRRRQRFTLAHELGHIRLGHQTQFDQNVGANHRAADRSGRPNIETAADTFASELLSPLHLVQQNANRQGWNPDDLREPEVIYQLSLRLGMSFKATCWTLLDHDVLSWEMANDYANRAGIVKEVKRSIVTEADLPHSHADVWVLSQGDTGVHLEAGEDDLFVIRLEEKSASGYLWEVADEAPGVRVHDRQAQLETEYGSPSQRVIHLTFDTPGVHTISLKHKRPWNDKVADTIEVTVDNFGREKAGEPRQVRQSALSGAMA